jgi:putative Mn2+ efflux pump MntP
MLPFYELLGIAVAMGMDVFSVSMAVAAGPRTERQAFRLSFHFGLFQFFMPLIGWAVGHSVVGLVSAFTNWAAFGLVAVIGAHMIYEGFKPDDEKSDRDRSRGWHLVMLSLATSVDALGIGLAFGLTMGGGGILWSALVIGIMSSAMSLAGVFLSRRLRTHFGHQMEKVGGLILIAIGVRMLFP